MAKFNPELLENLITTAEELNQVIEPPIVTEDASAEDIILGIKSSGDELLPDDEWSETTSKVLQHFGCVPMILNEKPKPKPVKKKKKKKVVKKEVKPPVVELPVVKEPKSVTTELVRLGVKKENIKEIIELFEKHNVRLILKKYKLSGELKNESK